MINGYENESIKEYTKWIAECEIKEITIPGGDGQDMMVQVIKAIKNKDKKGMPGIINAHGGGAVFMRAHTESGYMSRLAASLDIVIFNIEYRLGPETKCPGGQKDAAEAVKYFHEHAEEYGLDNTKLSLNGLSGGAWIVAGAAILLGREEKHDLVKSHFWMFP